MPAVDQLWLVNQGKVTSSQIPWHRMDLRARETPGNHTKGWRGLHSLFSPWHVLRLPMQLSGQCVLHESVHWGVRLAWEFISRLIILVLAAPSSGLHESTKMISFLLFSTAGANDICIYKEDTCVQVRTLIYFKWAVAFLTPVPWVIIVIVVILKSISDSNIIFL